MKCLIQALQHFCFAAAVVTLGGYLLVGGAVASAMSQAAISEANEEDSDDQNGNLPTLVPAI